MATNMETPTDFGFLVGSWEVKHRRLKDLLAGSDEALITHNDQVYRLRRTGTGKLILTK